MISRSQILILLMSGVLFQPVILFANNTLERLPKGVSDSVDNTAKATIRAKPSIKTLHVSGANMIRVKLSEVQLGPNSYMVVTSVLDQASQTLNSQLLEEWQNTTAYFNGDSLTIKLVIAPGERGAYQIEEVFTKVNHDLLKSEEYRAKGGKEALLGHDDRVSSTDSRVGRILPVGCTGWLISTGVVLTAGHCYGPHNNQMHILQFNVPPSDAHGVIRNPPPADQYPIIAASIQSAPGSPNPLRGDDWAIFRVRNNLNGQSVFVKQDFFRVTSFFRDTNPDVQITGYGIDNAPPGQGGHRNATSQTQQTHVGSFVGEQVADPRVTIYYRVDTEPGNSGSPVFYPNMDIAIGIHTNGNCGRRTNCGTSFKNQRLTTALQDFYGANVKYVDATGNPVDAPDGTIYKPYRQLSTAMTNATSGDTLYIVKGHYADHPITFPNGKRLTLRAPSGAVSIGPLSPTSQ